MIMPRDAKPGEWAWRINRLARETRRNWRFVVGIGVFNKLRENRLWELEWDRSDFHSRMEAKILRESDPYADGHMLMGRPLRVAKTVNRSVYWQGPSYWEQEAILDMSSGSTEVMPDWEFWFEIEEVGKGWVWAPGAPRG